MLVIELVSVSESRNNSFDVKTNEMQAINFQSNAKTVCAFRVVYLEMFWHFRCFISQQIQRTDNQTNEILMK